MLELYFRVLGRVIYPCNVHFLWFGVYLYKHQYFTYLFTFTLPLLLGLCPEDCGFWIRELILVYLNLNLNIVIGILFLEFFTVNVNIGILF